MAFEFITLTKEEKEEVNSWGIKITYCSLGQTIGEWNIRSPRDCVADKERKMYLFDAYYEPFTKEDNRAFASAVLNKSNGNAIKALESIDTAHHSAIVYLNDDGVEIGHSYKNTGLDGILPDDIPSESAFSIRRADLESLPGDASVSGKIPMYEKLSTADQIQVKYIESKRLKGEYAAHAYGKLVDGLKNGDYAEVA